MNNILEKLYYGEISPCSEPTPNTEHYLKAKDEVNRLKEELVETHPECVDLLERYTDAIHIAAACEGLQDFNRGFQIGAQIMLFVTTTL